MEPLVSALRAAGEPSRLRILAALARAELTVSELTRVLGQSQPRVSRHLRLLVDAGLLERSQEGAWAFYHIARRGAFASLVPDLLARVPEDEPTLTADRERLREIHREHAAAADRYFRVNARKWDEIRSLHVSEKQVETAMLGLIGDQKLEEFLDIGTGTGRILQVFAPHVEHGTGIDANREMLAVARANLERAGIAHCRVRHGDIARLPVGNAACDLVAIHLVLHYLDDPAIAIAEAARALRGGGRLIVVDFARHSLEFLRTEHAHRRLGFSDDEVALWCRRAGIDDLRIEHLSGGGHDGSDALTVTLWSGLRAGAAADPRASAVSNVTRSH